jgi:hypothetical protein
VGKSLKCLLPPWLPDPCPASSWTSPSVSNLLSQSWCQATALCPLPQCVSLLLSHPGGPDLLKSPRVMWKDKLHRKVIGGDVECSMSWKPCSSSG